MSIWLFQFFFYEMLPMKYVLSTKQATKPVTFFYSMFQKIFVTIFILTKASSTSPVVFESLKIFLSKISTWKGMYFGKRMYQKFIHINYLQMPHSLIIRRFFPLETEIWVQVLGLQNKLESNKDMLLL